MLMSFWYLLLKVHNKKTIGNCWYEHVLIPSFYKAGLVPYVVILHVSQNEKLVKR